MTSGRPISEEDLHAFVDGLLDPERHTAVERYLHDHGETAARVRGWQTGRAAVRALRGEAALQPIPATLNVQRLLASRYARHWAPTRVAAGLALTLTAGAAMGWFARQVAPAAGVSALGAEAVDAHRVFAGDLAHAVEFSPGALSGQLGWIGRFVGHSIVVPDLSSSGYRLLGARLVATPQGAGCLFLYDGGSLGRISILMRSMHDADVNAAMRAVRSPVSTGFAWARDGLGISVVADGNAEALHRLSDRVRDETSPGL